MVSNRSAPSRRRVRITEPGPTAGTQRVYHLIWDGLAIVQQKHYLDGVLQDTRDYFANGERRTIAGPSSRLAHAKRPCHATILDLFHSL
jgi:hypothetical protein